MFQLRWLFASLLVCLSTAHAQNLASHHHYAINERAERAEFSLFSEMELMVRTPTLNLLHWIERLSSLEESEPYHRLYHFGRWINDPTDDTCYNTRGRVLQRDSKIPVVSLDRRCKIDKGLWSDPYTNSQIEKAREVQIDHVVPLKNAYISGAYRWSKRERCLYANYMGNTFHLMSVSSRENMSKGDRHPGRYLPPEENYRCDYLKAWLKIKLIWGLTLSIDEAQGIQDVMQAYRCHRGGFKMTIEELRHQRSSIRQTDYVCRY